MNSMSGNLVVIDTVEEEGQRLEEHQGGHDPVDPEHLLTAILPQNEDPEAARQEEEDGHHLIKSWQRHFTRRQIIVRVHFLYLDCE